MPFLGVPASGRDVAFDVIDVLELRDGRIVAHECVVDQLGLLRQVGSIPRSLRVMRPDRRGATSTLRSSRPGDCQEARATKDLARARRSAAFAESPARADPSAAIS